MNRSITILIAILLMASTGCKKFLDKKQNDAQRELTALSDFQAALDVRTIMNNHQAIWRLEGSSDDFFITDAQYKAFPDEYRAVYVWQPFNYGHSNEWANYYRAVAQANLVLEGLEGIPPTASNKADWENVKGSALFYRAYYFLFLTWTHGKAYDGATSKEDLGISLRTIADFNVTVQRSNVEDSYQKIIEDALAATELLPNYSLHVVRPSKAAAYALLARAYLSMRKYEAALKYADLCLKIKSDIIDYNAEVPDLNIIAPFPEYNKEIIFYNETSSFLVNTSFAFIDTALYNSYASNDLRKKAYFRFVNGYPQFKGSYTTGQAQFFCGLATDEILLIKAECLARDNKYTEARAELGYLLERRFESGAQMGLPSQNEELLPFILNERRKELLMRGLRWQDLKRLNKEGANITPKRIIEGKTYQMLPNENRYALPLPNDIIELTGMTQNPT